MEDNIIDYGVWTCPKSWDDITLKKYQDIEIFYEGKDKHDVRDIIHILCDKTPDEVNALPLEFLDEIMENMLFLNEAPKIEKPSNIIEIDKEKYQVNIMEKLKGKYETVFIVNTELGEEKVQELVAKFKGRIEKNATVENVDEWGKRRLAYPIDDVNDGYYVVMQYTADRDFPVELERRFSITEGILRSMTIRLDA